MSSLCAFLAPQLFRIQHYPFILFLPHSYDVLEESSIKKSIETKSINGQEAQSESYQSKQLKSETTSHLQESTKLEAKSHQVTTELAAEGASLLALTSASIAAATSNLAATHSSTMSSSNAVTSNVASASMQSVKVQQSSSSSETAISSNFTSSFSPSTTIQQSASKESKLSFAQSERVESSSAARRKSSVAELSALIARRASGAQMLSESAESKTHVLMYSANNLQTKSSSSSESVAMRASSEKSAEDKLGELDGRRPHFIKTIRGTSIERKHCS